MNILTWVLQILFSDPSNMFGDDSRLSVIIKKIIKESERDCRLTAAQQLEEFLNSPDNYQVKGSLKFAVA